MCKSFMKTGQWTTLCILVYNLMCHSLMQNNEIFDAYGLHYGKSNYIKYDCI